MSSKNRTRQVIQPTQKEEVQVVKNDQLETTTEEVTESNAEETGVTESQETQVEETTSAPTVVESTIVEKEVKPTQSKLEGHKPVFKVELELNNYAEAMDKKNAINPEEGGRWQYTLFMMIKNILNAKSQEEFNKEWNTVLVYFNKNKDGIFNEGFMFRFPEQWPGSASEFTIFRRIVYVVIQTADHKGRKKALAEVNMAMVCEGLTEAQKSMLLNYYGV